jgi:hypothetical protein
MTNDVRARESVAYPQERRLPGSMIDDEFEAGFELILLSVIVLAKRAACSRGCLRGSTCQSQSPGPQKKRRSDKSERRGRCNISGYHSRTGTRTCRYCGDVQKGPRRASLAVLSTCRRTRPHSFSLSRLSLCSDDTFNYLPLGY